MQHMLCSIKSNDICCKKSSGKDFIQFGNHNTVMQIYISMTMTNKRTTITLYQTWANYIKK